MKPRTLPTQRSSSLSFVRVHKTIILLSFSLSVAFVFDKVFVYESSILRFNEMNPLYQGESANPRACSHSSHSSNSSVDWTVVVTGNSGYEPDLKCWLRHCQRIGLCVKHDASKSECQEPPNVIFYAEDPTIYRKTRTSNELIVKKAWEIPSRFANDSILEEGSDKGAFGDEAGTYRFAYDDHKQFFPMMSRRPTILLRELQELRQRELTYATKHNASINLGLVFSDLDVFLLQDPRPFFRGDLDMWGANARNSKTGPYNAGFLALRPPMIPIMEAWRDLLESRVKASPNQMSFNNLLKRLGPQLGLKHELLPKGSFPVGKYLHDLQKEHREELKKMGLPMKPMILNSKVLKSNIVAFHNNYCEGSCNKTKRAIDLGLC